MLELAADGRVLVMTPTGSETGGRNSELCFQLQRFARSGSIWKAFDSSTGFRFPDNALLSSALMPPWFGLIAGSPWPRSRGEALPPAAPIWCFSGGPNDEGPQALSALRSKMAAYQAHGARLGWLLIPHQQVVEVWPGSGDLQRLEGISVLEGGLDFPGLQLQLDEIWAG